MGVGVRVRKGGCKWFSAIGASQKGVKSGFPTFMSCIKFVARINMSFVLFHFFGFDVFDCSCRIHMAPFSDEYLYVEIASKVRKIVS